MRTSTLRILCPTWTTNGTPGIWTALQQQVENEPTWSWFNSSLAELMDQDYIDSLSGDTFVLPEVYRLADRLQDETQLIAVLARRFLLSCGTSVLKHEAVRGLVYEPIENYNMIEKEDEDHEDHDRGKTSADTSDKKNAYNTPDPVPLGSSHGETTGNNDNEGEYHRTLTRSGNIGVTTSQQMIQSELDLWARYDLINFMYNKLDKITIMEVF